MVMQRTLDHRTRYDERSRNYAISDVVEAVPLRTQYWAPGKQVLDQGMEGACVGFGISNDLSASPVRVKKIDDRFAQGLYKGAQTRDEEPGENYSGTSVLAGMQEATARGYYTEYRWAFSLDDVKQSLIQVGPVVIGISWYSSMYEAPNGLVSVSGELVGGHCILLTGVTLNYRKRGLAFRWRNSWGTSYGVNGNAYIYEEDLHRLLITEQGEAAIPLGRRIPA